MLRTTMSMAGILEDHPESHSSVSHYPFDLSHHPGAPLGQPSHSQENVMAPDQVVLDAELKGLKAAFKQAIGGGKKKKAKGRKKKADSSEGIPEEQPAAAQSDAVESDLPLPRQYPNNHVFNSQNRDKITADAIDNSHSVISRNSLIMTSWNGNANGLQYSPGKTFAAAPSTLDRCKWASPPTIPLAASSPSTINAAVPWNAVTVSQKTSAKASSVTEITEETRSDTSSVTVKLNVLTLEEVERACEAKEKMSPAKEADSDDSFVDKITERSPAKPVIRIEDSVDELDRLEEQLEEDIQALGQATAAERVISPVLKWAEEQKPQGPLISSNLRRFAKSGSKTQTMANEVVRALKEGKPGSVVTAKPGQMSLRVKPTEVQSGPLLRRSKSAILKSAFEAPDSSPTPATGLRVRQQGTIKRPTSLLPPKPAAKSTKQPTKSSFELSGDAVAKRIKEAREARISQRGTEDSVATAVLTPRIKSTKPPTRPAFELPGEALSRRKRELHEAQLKKQQEEEKKRREFKARPISRAAPSTLPRETVASRARKSILSSESAPIREQGSIGRRQSMIGSSRPSILANEKALANTPAPLHRGPGPRPGSIRKSMASSGHSSQHSVSNEETQTQRQRAKEIYNRDTQMQGELQDEKRKREDAAKRARAEAAERGRQASREWAEKHKTKKMAEGDQGLSAGYGPGGQLGLKA